MRDLQKTIEMLRSFDGISRKFVIPNILSKLRATSYNGNSPHSLGEDSAAILTDTDYVVLLTTDAIVEELCLHHPHAAGFNAVLANIMDIYAAGGVPTSFAIALSYSDETVGEKLLEGVIEGSNTFEVPIVRGHTNPASESTYVVGSATGTVKKQVMLTSGGAKAGESLVLLFDSTGRRGSSYRLGWDSVTGRDSDTVTTRLSVMNELAERKLVSASKDVSVSGIVGTAGMMLEYSGTGGVLVLDWIERSRPEEIEMDDWLRMFISLGFLLSVPENSLSTVEEIAISHGMKMLKIGYVDSQKTLRLRQGDNEDIMFDYSKGPVLIPRGTP